MKILSCSPSRLDTASKCDFKYYMCYMLGISDKLSASPFASNFGKSVHNVLEEYALSKGTLDWRAALLKEISKKDMRPYDVMEAASKRVKAQFFVDKDCHNCPFFQKRGSKCKIVQQHVDKFEGCPKRLHEDALKMTEAAIERYAKYFDTGIRSAENPNGKVLGVEHEFTIELGKDEWGDPIVMHGLIDLVVEQDPDTVLVIDYKTGFKTQNADELMKDMQARMYSCAAKHEFPEYKYVFLSFDYFRGVPTDVVFTQDQDDATKDIVRRRWNEIKGKRNIKRRSYDWYCQYLCNRPECDAQWEILKDKVKQSKQG